MERPKQHEIIIYGGAFNPPTLAHTAILQACVEFAKSTQSEVWVMPSGVRHDKTIDVPRAIRLRYVRAMIADTVCGDVAVKVMTNELDHEYPTETYDTVQLLEAEYPECDFRFVFGADSTQTMASWRGGSELLERLSMLVVDRPGSSINPEVRHALKLPIVTADVSSTEVRYRQANGLPVDHLVSPRVQRLL